VTADTNPVTVASREQWFAAHNKINRPLFIVENEAQEIVGWLSYQSFYGRPAYAETAEISIYLAEAYRNQGFGKQILQYAMECCPVLAIKTLLGYIFAHNTPSLQLFHHFGFENWGFLPNIAVLDDKRYSLIIVGKRIW
jgi:phosphinothricin acetyltransferase